MIADQVVFGTAPDVNARANAARQEAIDRGDTLSRIGYISGRVGAIANFGTVAIAAAPASSLVPAYAATPVLVTATGGGAATTYYRGTAAYYAYQAGDTLAFEDNLLYSIESGIGTIAGGAQLRSTIAPWRTTTAVPQVRAISRQSTRLIRDVETGIEHVSPAFKDLSPGAKRIVSQLSKRRNLKAGDSVAVEDLRQASHFLGRELGVARNKGRLFIRCGISDRVTFRPGDRPLVHTHPTFVTRKSHFQRYDIPNADDFIEAVVDLSGEITYFNRTGVIKKPQVSPIVDGVIR